MASNTPTDILQNTDAPHSGGCNDPRWPDAWNQVSKIAMVALTLQGHEQHLFKRQSSFKEGRKYMDAPHMSPAFQFHSLTQLFNMTRLTTSWKHRGATITEAMWNLNWEGDTDEKKTGAPYVKKLLRLFINQMPVMSFEEIHLEYKSKKHLVGGSIDLAVGFAAKGDKPTVKITNSDQRWAIFLGSLGEAKAADVKLATVKKKSFTSEEEDIKSIIQPALEVMAVSAVATFPNNNIPLVNIMASKCGFRPILYWTAYDLLITTAKAVPLRLDDDRVDIRGLLLLFTLFQVHRSGCILFNQAVLRGKPPSGWAAALATCQHTYQHSDLTLGKARAGPANYGTEFLTAPSDSSCESSEDDNPFTGTKRQGGTSSPSTSKRPKLDQPIRPEQK